MRFNKKKKEQEVTNAEAPGIDPDDSFGEKANEQEIKSGESTRVIRLTYDEHEERNG
ncbi:hypothetical protein [Virgibacillus kimchii]